MENLIAKRVRCCDKEAIRYALTKRWIHAFFQGTLIRPYVDPEMKRKLDTFTPEQAKYDIIARPASIPILPLPEGYAPAAEIEHIFECHRCAMLISLTDIVSQETAHGGVYTCSKSLESNSQIAECQLTF